MAEEDRGGYCRRFIADGPSKYVGCDTLCHFNVLEAIQAEKTHEPHSQECLPDLAFAVLLQEHMVSKTQHPAYACLGGLPQGSKKLMHR